MQTNTGFTVEKIGRVNESAARGEQYLWKISPPIKFGWDYDKETTTDACDFVVTSAASVPFSGPETYIFPANHEGEIVDWMELPGSFQGSFDHEEAIMNVNHRSMWS